MIKVFESTYIQIKKNKSYPKNEILLFFFICITTFQINVFNYSTAKIIYLKL